MATIPVIGPNPTAFDAQTRVDSEKAAKNAAKNEEKRQFKLAKLQLKNKKLQEASVVLLFPFKLLLFYF